MEILLMMYKVVHRCRDNDPCPRDNVEAGVMTRLRSAPTLSVKKPNSARFIKTTSYVGPTLWHSLPANVRLIFIFFY